MKANELMIGDWVRIVDDDTNQYFETRITGISDLGNIYAPLPEGEHSYPFAAECADPIPLTREILEQNGWSEDYNAETDILGHHFPEDKDLNLELYISDVDETVVWTLNCYEYGVLPLRYVHELQHALRLSGIHKEITI